MYIYNYYFSDIYIMIIATICLCFGYTALICDYILCVCITFHINKHLKSNYRICVPSALKQHNKQYFNARENNRKATSLFDMKRCAQTVAISCACVYVCICVCQCASTSVKYLINTHAHVHLIVKAKCASPSFERDN
jgi:hypothetical protein